MIRIVLPDVAATDIAARIAHVTRAEAAADCEASGYEILIVVHPGVGAEATLRLGGGDVALGSANISFDATTPASAGSRSR